MKEIIVISGKGGTGKTSLSAAFAYLARHSVLCDADVDAADLHLLMAPKVKQQTDFQGGGVAIRDPDRCTACGICKSLCRFEAVQDDYRIDPIACEGCGVCVDFCPERAIDFPTKTCGQWFRSETRFGPMVHARLGIAEENSGKLVTLVRQEAKKTAEAEDIDLIITDGPPGIGCPVIAAIGGATAVLIVTEPTVSGMHDMDRVVELATHFRIPAMVCINKFDLNPQQTNAVEAKAEQFRIPVIGRIPFDRLFVDSLIQRKTIFEYGNGSKTSQSVEALWANIMDAAPMSGTRRQRRYWHG